MKIKTTLTALTLSAGFVVSANAQTTLFTESFDNATGFTSSEGFFADTFGDFLGLTGGTDDFGAGTAPPGLKAYTGFTGSYLTGMDLDGEGATLPVTFNWSGINISGYTNLGFSGDFAEFFDSPGDIDDTDQLLVEAQIDGGGYVSILEFIPGSFTSSASPSNGFFEFGVITLGDVAQEVTAVITGTGNLLDLRLTVSLNSGDEDFAVDNFTVSGVVPEPSTYALLAGMLALTSVMLRRRVK